MRAAYSDRRSSLPPLSSDYRRTTSRDARRRTGGGLVAGNIVAEEPRPSQVERLRRLQIT